MESLTQGVTQMGHAVAAVDMPCNWAQFLYACAEHGMEDSATIIIATWYREGPGMTKQLYMNHGHPDGDIVTSLMAYRWFGTVRENACRSRDQERAWMEELTSCQKVGLMHHAMHSIWESVELLNSVFVMCRATFQECQRDT